MPDFSRCLPADWSQNKLHEIAAAITSGGTPTSGDPRYYCEGEGIPFAKTEDLSRSNTKWISECELNISVAALKETAAKIYPEGTILVSMYGTIGLPKITNKELSANQALCALIPPFKCDLDYLYHHLVFTRDGWKKFSGQTTQANINGYIVRNHDIPLPLPREQQKIAQILDTLDTQIQKTEALIAKLEKIKEGLLHDLLTRGIDQNGQLRPTPEQAPELYKESVLGLIPKEWEVRQLGSMSEIVSGVTLGGQQPSSSWPLVAYLRVANVQDGYLDLDQIKFLRVKPGDVEKFRLIPGDVLMNEGGDFDKLGRGTVWEGEIELCIHQNHVFRVRTYPKVLDQYFLAYFSGSSMGKCYFVKSSKQSTNLASINSTQLKAFDVPVPPLSEQTAIVDILQSHQRRLEQENTSMNKLQAQKAGLMDDLLTGHVRVTPLLKDAV